MIHGYKTCPQCGAPNIPVEFDFCGRCGNRFEPSSTENRVITDATVVNRILADSPEAMETFEHHGIHICGGCIVLLNGTVRETAEYSGLSPTEASQLVEELNEKVTGMH